MGFSENLRRLRTQAGLTQQQMAQRVGIPYRSYQNWEMGSREPRIAALKTIAAALGVSVDALVENGGGSAPTSATAEKAKRKPRKK